MPLVPLDSCTGTQLGYNMPDNMVILFLKMFLHRNVIILIL